MTDSFFKKGAIFGGMTFRGAQLKTPKKNPTNTPQKLSYIGFAKGQVFL
jgi:hypothetical protein